MTGEVIADGIAASYSATFVANQLQRIAENRPESRSGEYEFHGARLLRYAGAGLSDERAIELRLNLQGAVTMSRAGTGEISPAEVSALLTRAQLLRSHALVQHSIISHRMH